ncbi:putative damage-inducible protein DinB [Pedobacter sp. CG_S7]|uniref:DinB family protein n=1 Tax=Pedobacter sp. CG_S7 TaxID=3143930 RepID=UPI00339ADD9A
MKRIFAILICLCTVHGANAQSTDSLQTQLARKWVNSKIYALNFAALMPEHAYDFKASPEEMTFGEQLLHIADNMNWLSSSYLLIDTVQKREKTAKLSKAEIINIVSDAYDHGLRGHLKMNKDQLDEKVKFFAGPMTRRQLLILMHDHQTHHLGQLIVYLRLKGIKPPDYVGW